MSVEISRLNSSISLLLSDAEFDGKIISINIGDGEPVEFGQELISIEKS